MALLLGTGHGKFSSIEASKNFASQAFIFKNRLESIASIVLALLCSIFTNIIIRKFNKKEIIPVIPGTR